MSNDEYPLDRDAGSLWDRIWRGRSSSHRRILANATLHAARCTDALREATRLIDTVASDRRQAEGLALALQIRDLAEGMMALADHLQAEFRRG